MCGIVPVLQQSVFVVAAEAAAVGGTAGGVG